ncbi:MAG TPA: FmdB family zinc ribbon protein [Chloroflexia bacterium]|jgi:putative FmdB family regulatory protein
MPIYEYECKNCASRFEKMQPITAEPLTECVNCGGGPIHRIFHPVGVIFKGSGWYINDSRKSNSSKEDGGGAGASDKSDGDKSSSDKNTSDKTASSESTAAASKEASKAKDAPASAPASD